MSGRTAPARVQRRYDLMARAYDQVTIERLVYARARAHAVQLLRLQPGDTVLDIGCGTGMSLPGLRAEVGPTGTVVGIDLSPKMLDKARQRAEHEGWANVHLVQADATTLPELPLPEGTAAPSAALFALSLSPMPNPHAVLGAVADALPPGARLAVMDAGTPPARTRWRWLAPVLSPIWLGVCRFAAADPHAHPWQHVPGRGGQVQPENFHFGYVRVAATTIDGAAPT